MAPPKGKVPPQLKPFLKKKKGAAKGTTTANTAKRKGK